VPKSVAIFARNPDKQKMLPDPASGLHIIVPPLIGGFRMELQGLNGLYRGIRGAENFPCAGRLGGKPGLA
jgi:hypothetical protein